MGMSDEERAAIANEMAAWEDEHSSSPRWSAIGWLHGAVDPMLAVLDRLGYEVVRRA